MMIMQPWLIFMLPTNALMVTNETSTTVKLTTSRPTLWETRIEFPLETLWSVWREWIQKPSHWQRTEEPAVIVCLKRIKRQTTTTIKDTTRILLITRIRQWQQIEACLSNAVTVLSSSYFILMSDMAKIYLFTRTMQRAVLRSAWLRIGDVFIRDTHARADSLVSERKLFIVRAIQPLNGHPSIPTARIRVQGRIDTSASLYIYI